MPLAAHASMDAPLPQQHSWGSPRSSDMQRSVSSSDTVAALMQEVRGNSSGRGREGGWGGVGWGGGWGQSASGRAGALCRRLAMNGTTSADHLQ